jgi:polyisoprenyl-phosphate glycosyltransferase
MKGKADLTVVIPVYNSEKTIETLVDGLVGIYRGKYDLNIVAVNDGSIDGSREACLRLSKKYDIFKYIELSKNFGQHNALLAGIRHARGDLVVTMDDDLQHPPEEVEKLISKINEGFDVVYARYAVKRHCLSRNIGTRLNNIMAWWLVGKPFGFDFTSFRVMRRFVAEEISRYDAPFPYLDGLIMRATNNIGVAVVRHEARREGGSNYTFRKLLGLWLNGFFNFSLLPLRLCTYGGAALALCGFVFTAVQVFLKITDPSRVLGWTSIITSIFILSGVQLIAVGVIGEYVGRVFLTQNKSPAYVVRGINN